MYIHIFTKKKLNREDSEAFVAALLEPPPPNDALRIAALNYKRKKTQPRPR